MPDPYTEAVVGVVRGMSKAGPKPMLKRVRFELEDADVPGEFTETDLVGLLTSDHVNEPARYEFHIQLTKWDSVADPAWSSDSAPNTPERRSVILDALGLSEESKARIDHAFPVSMIGAVVISGKPADWDPWYTDELAAQRSFYWDGYRGVLEEKGWSAHAIGELGRTTDEVVKRLADPTRSDPYQSKGLVVGHVQSGKTANFTGVIAKAIDAGYKLVIVLTGTIELLRGQTQRRLDMELIGEENILGGVARDDQELIAEVDYIGDGDIDWREGRFVSYGKDPKELGVPGIRRLTRARDDYKLLKAGLGYLDFRQTDHLVDPARPLYHEQNIYKPDIRIAVVKKNSAVLRKLVRDLRATKTDLGEIPALIIDDEADQASINTTRPKKDAAEVKERTAINRLIAQLLGELKRAQYVGYTATPFANVFVDPEDAQDIFPKDFIVSLDPPDDYMGGRDFHDLDRETDGGLDEDEETAGLTVANSNEKAFIRSLEAGPDDAEARDKEMLTALDAYVLSGALKLFRAEVLGKPKLFRHHTMLVHESVKTAEHGALAADIRRVWNSAGYDLPAGLKRLNDLWESDFRPVTSARAPEAPILPSFHALRPQIGHAVDKIQRGANPVVIVNGVAEQDYAQADINFQTGDVWKILVGGAKLSRGFTVEGLTISYYTRRTIAADTLMQMGRWFGYRPNYHDLVRLYIGRNVPAPKGKVMDLYKSFEAIVRDEEDFRDELRKFQGFEEDGRPRVRPMDVPPLVYQSLPYLKPTSTSKMYNAELTEQGEGGKVVDFNQQGEHADTVNERHFDAVQPLLDAAGSVGDFFYINTAGAPRPWRARYGLVEAASLLEIIRQFSWANNFNVSPYLAFMEKAIAGGTLKDWAVIIPEISSLPERTVAGRTLRIMRRFRRGDRPWQFSGSSTRQRDALLAISGGIDATTVDVDERVASALSLPEYAHVKELKVPTRGAFLLTFAGDSASARLHDAKGVTDPKKLPDPTDPKNVATLFSYALPLASAPAGRIAFAVRRRDRPDDPIVDSGAGGRD